MGDGSHHAEDRVLRIGAALERPSEHPVAAAVVGYAQQRGLNLPQPESFESQTGHGVVGIVEGNLTVIGNTALMKHNSISVQTLTAAAERLAEEGKTPPWIAIKGSLAGIIAVADTGKATSIEAICQVH